MSSFLDRAEDPGQTLDYSYQKQIEQLQGLRKSIADVVTSEKRLVLQEAQVNQPSEKLDGQASQAVGVGPEDPARPAPERNQARPQQAASFAQQNHHLKSRPRELLWCI